MVIPPTLLLHYFTLPIFRENKHTSPKSGQKKMSHFSISKLKTPHFFTSKNSDLSCFSTPSFSSSQLRPLLWDQPVNSRCWFNTEAQKSRGLWITESHHPTWNSFKQKWTKIHQQKQRNKEILSWRVNQNSRNIYHFFPFSKHCWHLAPFSLLLPWLHFWVVL